MSWAIYSMVAGLGAIEQLGANVRLQSFARERRRGLWRRTTCCSRRRSPQRPLPLGTLDTVRAPTRCRRSRARACSRRSPRSSTRTGQPAVSLPLFQGDDGLPLAVQLVGRPAQEGPLLALAAQLEDAVPVGGSHAGRRLKIRKCAPAPCSGARVPPSEGRQWHT